MLTRIRSKFANFWNRFEQSLSEPAARINVIQLIIALAVAVGGVVFFWLTYLVEHGREQRSLVADERARLAVYETTIQNNIPALIDEQQDRRGISQTMILLACKGAFEREEVNSTKAATLIPLDQETAAKFVKLGDGITGLIDSVLQLELGDEAFRTKLESCLRSSTMVSQTESPEREDPVSGLKSWVKNLFNDAPPKVAEEDAQQIKEDLAQDEAQFDELLKTRLNNEDLQYTAEPSEPVNSEGVQTTAKANPETEKLVAAVQAPLTITAGSTRGYAVDVFWCESDDMGARMLRTAARLADQLRDNAKKWDVGRVRLRPLSKVRQLDPGYPSSGRQLRHEDNETDFAEKLNLRLKSYKLTNREIDFKTPYYVSIFICPTPKTASQK